MTSLKQEDAYDVIVIGGGASGMMAAGVAAATVAEVSGRLKRVLLIEKNKKDIDGFLSRLLRILRLELFQFHKRFEPL